MRQKLSAFAAPLLWAGLLALTSTSIAQAQTPSAARSPLGWQTCQALKADPTAQLACFQQWADAQTPANMPAPSLTTAPANPATAAGQQNPSGGPMGTTGVTPESGAAARTTTPPTVQSPPDTSSSSRTTMAASGDTPAMRRARADRN